MSPDRSARRELGIVMPRLGAVIPEYSALRIETLPGIPTYVRTLPREVCMAGPLISLPLRVGAESLRANPLRSALSTLGVVFGVASLVSVLAVGDGAEQFARQQIARTTDLQTIVVSANTGETIDGVRIPRASYPVFTISDAESLAARLGDRALVSAMTTGSSLLEAAAGADSAPRAAVVIAVTPGVAERLQPSFAAGRFLNAGDMQPGRAAAVLSAGLARGAAAGVGDSITLGATRFEVVGVLDAKTAGVGGNTAVIPFPLAGSAMVAAASPRAPQLLVRVANVEEVASVEAAVEGWAAARLGPGWKDEASVAAGGPQLRIDQARQGILIFKMVMGTFAGISLIVGGIGIMNVLLAAVTERTR